MKPSEMPYQTVKVTFRFVGDNIDPKVITSIIGIQPSVACTKGDTVEKCPDRIYPTELWGLESSVSPDYPLEAHLKHLLDVLEPHVSIIAELGRREFFRISFVVFCGRDEI